MTRKHASAWTWRVAWAIDALINHAIRVAYNQADIAWRISSISRWHSCLRAAPRRNIVVARIDNRRRARFRAQEPRRAASRGAGGDSNEPGVAA